MHTHPEKGNGLFITSMFSMVLCIGLLLLSLYIIPYLFWAWPYGVPGMVVFLREWFVENYQLTDNGSAWAVLLSFLVPGLFAGLLTWHASSRFEHLELLDELEPEEEEKPKRDESSGESAGLGMQILFFIVLIFLGTWLVEQFISATLS